MGIFNWGKDPAKVEAGKKGADAKTAKKQREEFKEGIGMFTDVMNAMAIVKKMDNDTRASIMAEYKLQGERDDAHMDEGIKIGEQQAQQQGGGMTFNVSTPQDYAAMKVVDILQSYVPTSGQKNPDQDLQESVHDIEKGPENVTQNRSQLESGQKLSTERITHFLNQLGVDPDNIDLSKMTLERVNTLKRVLKEITVSQKSQ